MAVQIKRYYTVNDLLDTVINSSRQSLELRSITRRSRRHPTPASMHQLFPYTISYKDLRAFPHIHDCSRILDQATSDYYCGS